MFTIENAVGNVVATDAQSSVAALEGAVHANARLCASIIEGTAASALPIGETQAVLESLAAGMAQLIVGRANLVSTVRELTRIQSRSTLRTTSFGCPDGFPPRTAKFEQQREMGLAE